MSISPRIIFQALCLSVAVISLNSCASTVGVGPTSGSLVGTQIENSTQQRVNGAVKSVFLEDGFTLVSQSSTSFHFRKWGGLSTAIMYGSLQSEGVAAEPEILVTNLGNGRFMVNCDVYMRENKHDSLISTDYKLKASGMVAYNGLMKKVKTRAEAR